MPRLYRPLGIQTPFWETDENGVEAGGWGLWLRTEDLAKIMLCYQQGGVFQGEQVIPAFGPRQRRKSKLIIPPAKAQIRAQAMVLASGGVKGRRTPIVRTVYFRSLASFLRIMTPCW